MPPEPLIGLAASGHCRGRLSYPQSQLLNRQGHPTLTLGTRNAKTEWVIGGKRTKLLIAPGVFFRCVRGEVTTSYPCPPEADWRHGGSMVFSVQGYGFGSMITSMLRHSRSSTMAKNRMETSRPPRQASAKRSSRRFVFLNSSKIRCTPFRS